MDHNMAVVPAAVELQQISKSYSGQAGRRVLDALSLEITDGEFVAVMGPSGSGKSTLLHLVAGLDRPTSGSIRVGGTELTGLGEADLARHRRGRIGFVFQFFHLLNNLNVIDNVLIAAQLAGAAQRPSLLRARQLLAELGIADKASQYPTKLSGGERQRVAIARALINHPAVLLADEPTGALDSRTGEQVMQLLAGFNQRGQTIILATHDHDLAHRFAQRRIHLSDGHLVPSDQTSRLEPSADL